MIIISRRLASLLFALLLGASLQLISPASARAAQTCGTYDSYFAGFNGYNTSPSNWFEGVSSYIVVRDGALCSGTTPDVRFTSAWVMIASLNANRTSFLGYQQIGFSRTNLSGATGLRWFAQMYNGNLSDPNGVVTYFSEGTVGNQVGTKHAFRVTYAPTTQLMYGTIDGTLIQRSNFRPFDEWGPLPWSPQFNAEAFHRESDIPGRGSSRTTYSGLGGQRVSDHQLVPMPCILTGRVDTARWSAAPSGCGGFSVWTK